MDTNTIIEGLRAISKQGLWCKDAGERIAYDDKVIEGILKDGRGLPPLVRKFCTALGYLEKKGSGIQTTYHVTDAGRELCAREKEKTLALIKHIKDYEYEN